MVIWFLSLSFKCNVHSLENLNEVDEKQNQFSKQHDFTDYWVSQRLPHMLSRDSTPPRTWQAVVFRVLVFSIWGDHTEGGGDGADVDGDDNDADLSR